MTIKRLKNGVWQVDVTMGRNWDGSISRRKKRVRTKNEAELLDAQWQLDKHIKQGNVCGDIKFANFVDLIYWPLKEGQLRETTRKGYLRDIKLRLIPAFGDTYVSKINRLAIQCMINQCATKKVATNAKETLSALLTVAVEMELITVNPAKYTYVYPAEGQHDPEHYGTWLTTFAEHAKLFSWMRNNYEDRPEERLVVLGLGLGLRKGEILGLDWEDIDFIEQTAHIKQTYTSALGTPSLNPPKTKRSNRVIPLPDYVYQRLFEWNHMDKHEDVDLKGNVCHPIICGINRKRLNPKTAADKMQRVKGFYPDGTAVPNVTLYSLRHSFATACDNAGMEISKLSLILGHTNTATTYNRYVKPKLNDVRQEMAIIDAQLEIAM